MNNEPLTTNKSNRRERTKTEARMRCVLLFALAMLFASVVAAQERHAVLVGGLGGSAVHSSAFQSYLLESRRALVETFGFSPSDVTVLAEPDAQGLDPDAEVATAENIRARFAELTEEVEADDQVYVFLFGHGSFDGEQAYLNIPRRDLSGDDYAALVDSLGAARVVFVNTASASGPFVETLSAPGRIVITATRTGTQRNETVFPQFFVEALTAGSAADLDKDGGLSVRELFAYASEKTAQSYEETGHLATEHALLEDTGDGEGHTLGDLEEAGEGAFADVTYLRPRARPVAAAGGEATEQWREREAVERAIAELKSRKAQLEEDAYYAELETLFVRLARLNDALEANLEN